MDTVKSTQGELLEEVKKQSAKFGDDVKYLAEFTAGVKKFDPWIQKAEAKKAVGMPKPKNLEEATDQLADAKVNKSVFPRTEDPFLGTDFFLQKKFIFTS